MDQEKTVEALINLSYLASHMQLEVWLYGPRIYHWTWHILYAQQTFAEPKIIAYVTEHRILKPAP